jgi:hypothetical protein
VIPMPPARKDGGLDGFLCSVREPLGPSILTVVPNGTLEHSLEGGVPHSGLQPSGDLRMKNSKWKMYGRFFLSRSPGDCDVDGLPCSELKLVTDREGYAGFCTHRP